MLSQYERRQLEAIERGLTAEDPRLAVTLKAGEFRRFRWLLTAMWVFGLGCFVLGCFTGSLALVMAGCTFTAVGMGLWYRGRLRRRSGE